jgi:8-oxo-dGTP pyrophosphatase MutT (NUDIX family)
MSNGAHQIDDTVKLYQSTLQVGQLGQSHTSKMYCTNCGSTSHYFRQCISPVFSYGVIAFRHSNPNWNQVDLLSSDDSNFSGFKYTDLEFLLIQRKHSIGYIEMIRGKYKINDIQYILEQISGTTLIERNKLETLSFNDLWKDVWGEENQKYKNDLEHGKLKFETLKQGILCPETNKVITLKSLIATTPCKWDTPEWGFPKGRRNIGESDSACAAREFREETGLTSDQFCIFENMDPIRETFFGNNNVQYCHVYSIAWIPSHTDITFKNDNYLLCQEIGDIGWFSLDNAFNRIRSTNIEKREILIRTSTILRNFSCLLVGPVLGQGSSSERYSSFEVVNRKSCHGGCGEDSTESTSESENDSSRDTEKSRREQGRTRRDDCTNSNQTSQANQTNRWTGNTTWSSPKRHSYQFVED